MIFNSLEFFLFLPIVFILYWFVVNKNLKLQNALLLVASYVFYGWWDWRFLSLIAASTVVDYISGLKINDTDNEKLKSRWLWFSMAFNLGLLGFFKYFNFFVQSWIDAFASIGYTIDPITINIILPVGISFYTFQTMSYSLDIYHNRLQPTKDFIGFAAFVSFFPQLVAGPIERASNLLPQILNKRTFNYKQGVEGLELILLGLFKKIVVADSLSPAVTDIFSNYGNYTGGTLLLGVFYFAMQIYADFSGYTDIARGTSKLLSFELMINFNFPYFSKNIPEYWRRWHISLSSWFNDYLFTPLALRFRNFGKNGLMLGIIITFFLSGLWHGAGWNFIAWGVIHGLFFIPFLISGKRFTSISSQKVSKEVSSIKLKDTPAILFTFTLILISYVFFRSATIADAFHYFGKLGSTITELNFFENLTTSTHMIMAFKGFVGICYLLIFDYLQMYNKKVPFNRIILILLIIFAGSISDSTQFIYFQF